MSAESVFRGRLYACDFFPGNTPYTVLAFQSWIAGQSMKIPNISESFLTGKGVSCFCVRNAENDWGQSDELMEMLDAVKDRSKGRLKGRFIGYGMSMGGYQAINFGKYMEFDYSIAISPQYSIDGNVVPWETRWRPEAEKLRFQNDFIKDMRREFHAKVVYDPFFRIDRVHIDRIAEKCDVHHIPFHNAGHDVGRSLRECSALSELVLGLFENRDARRDLLPRVRAARANSPSYLFALSRNLAVRRRLVCAAGLAERAFDLSDGSNFDLVCHHATMLAQVGRREDAAAVLTPYLSNPVRAPLAEKLIARFRST